ncbi:MAG TPA: hypothetical protein VFB62_06945 [Polyangiaceae bacterium]|nr:hypothetical protein [Polyangiaceae bacterium]
MNKTYQPDLAQNELIDTIRTLIAEQRVAEWLVCRYLADLADSLSGAYSDIYHASRCLFAMSVRKTRERLRVGRALRELPGIERAFVAGAVSYSRVREVTRVAAPDTEVQWLELARQLPMRKLERRVAEAGGRPRQDERTDEPADVGWTSPETLEVRLHLRAETWALLQRAMEGARRLSESETLLSDGEALEAVARDALAHQSESETTDVRRTVVLYECRTCERTELETGAGAIELPDGVAAALGCGARVRDLRTEGRIVKRGGSIPAAVARAVRLRDRDRCRVPGCNRRRYIEIHHNEHRSHGGEHSRHNCCCLCSTHHGHTHVGDLRIEGNAEAELLFYDRHGNPITDPSTQSGSQKDELSTTAAQILSLMGQRGGWHLDAICDSTGLPASDVGGALFLLELDRRVQRDPYGRYQRT